MTTPAIPAPRARRTRVPDRMTDAVLIVTAVFGIWGVALVVLTFIGITQPAFIYEDPKIAIKALGSTVVAALSVLQLYTMESVLGHLPRGGFKMKTMLRVHRAGGRVAVVLAVLIAYFCMTDVGAPHTPWRVAIHAIFGATAFSLLGLKFGLIRFAPELAYDAAPWIGRVVAACFIVIWLSSGLAYYTGNL